MMVSMLVIKQPKRYFSLSKKDSGDDRHQHTYAMAVTLKTMALNNSTFPIKKMIILHSASSCPNLFVTGLN